MLQLLVNMIMPQNLPASCCNFTESDILLIRISAKFDVDLWSTFLTFSTRSCSNSGILQLLVNMIMAQNLPASCCNFTGSDVLLIRISAKFDVDLCVTFLNFQTSSQSSCLVNVITPQVLPIWCCNLKGMFSTSTYQTSSILTFV